jgi:hypothetical protein
MQAFLKAIWHFPRQLKLLIFLRFLKAMSESGLGLIFILYLTEHFNFNTMHANWLYIAWNVLGATWAIPIGWTVDYGSLRGNLITGAVLNCIGKFATLLDYSTGLSLFSILVVSNLGAEFAEKVLSVAVSRIIPKTETFQRNVAFQFSYSVENIGAAICYLYWDYVSNNYPDSSIFLIMFFSSMAGTLFFFFSFAFVNPDSQGDLKVQISAPNMSQTLRAIVMDRVFWRLVAFGFALVGLGVFWNYNSVVFPLYMKYEIKSSHYGNVESINPIFIPLFTIIVGSVFSNVEPFKMVIWGSLVFALSALPMVFSSSMRAAELYVFWMTIGEALYSPKVELVEYNIAPQELAGTYTSLTKIPVGIFRVVGMFSNSFLIDGMCSANVSDKCSDIWIIATGVASTTFILLLVFAKFIQDKPVVVIKVAENDSQSDDSIIVDQSEFHLVRSSYPVTINQSYPDKSNQIEGIDTQ